MGVNLQSFSLPFRITSGVEDCLRDWTDHAKTKRLWSKDASLWTGSSEHDWMGWLDAVPDQITSMEHLVQIGEDVRNQRWTDALLVGMGGSSLCPEVLASTFGRVESCPQLRVLDSTDPAQVRSHREAVDLERTLLIVSSKSGTTLESSILFEYFFERIADATSLSEAGRRSIVITDPDSPLEGLARDRGLTRVFRGRADIGGRFSAFSDFGMVPAAIMGLDVSRLLGRAQEMVDACGSHIAPDRNPGVLLGLVMGRLAATGRDKMTIVATDAVKAIGLWLEQLVAESTGKQGKGLVPVDDEPLGSVETYGHDRFFVYLRQKSDEDDAMDRQIEGLAEAGHPLIRIELDDPYDIGQEFFRWEMATAVTGSLLGVNPFVQPDVEASKVAARRLTAEFEEQGALSDSDPILEESGIRVFADAGDLANIRSRAETHSLASYIGALLSNLEKGCYFTIQAYVEMNRVHAGLLRRTLDLVRSRMHVATCLGFGPRYLHSTGQLHKGGPATGVFLQVTCEDAEDIPVPGRSYSFGVVKAAQAAGDMEVLASRGRPILRVHIGSDVTEGLLTLERAFALELEHRAG